MADNRLNYVRGAQLARTYRFLIRIDIVRHAMGSVQSSCVGVYSMATRDTGRNLGCSFRYCSLFMMREGEDLVFSARTEQAAPLFFYIQSRRPPP